MNAKLRLATALAVGMLFLVFLAVVGANEGDVYSAPICCFVRIPNCYCDKPEGGTTWPEPACPTVYAGWPMVLYRAGAANGESWPDFCAKDRSP